MNKGVSVLLVMFVFAVFFSHFASAALNLDVTSQPTSVMANENLAVSWNLSHPLNMTSNLTYRLYVNGVNVVNQTSLNKVANVTVGYTETVTFNAVYYGEGQSVYISTYAQNSTGASPNNTTNSTTLTVAQSSTSLIANDTLVGLPSLGTQLGDFMGNIGPGLFKFLLLIGLAVAITALIVVVIGKVKQNKNYGKFW